VPVRIRRAGRRPGEHHVAQSGAKLGETGEAERRGEPGHRRLADAGQLGDLDGRPERDVREHAEHALHDLPLGRREPVPLGQLHQPVRGGPVVGSSPLVHARPP
jgi:hypothetical protein